MRARLRYRLVRDGPQRLALGPEESALGDALANTLDDLTDFAEQDSQGPIQNPQFGWQAAFGMEHISGFPEFLQNVQQIQNQGDAERPFDQNLQGALAIGERHTGLAALRITALHLLGHLLDEDSLALEQTGPHPFVLRTGRSLPTCRSLAADTEQAFHHLFRGAHPGYAAEHTGHGSHSLT